MVNNARTRFDMDGDIAWCPGCGHFAMHRILKAAMEELDLDPNKVVFVSGIGQAAKLPQYTRGNMFNGLHGRALPVAMAIKATNPELTVIVDSGDGCTYGEGGNHFTAQILRNSDITVIAHNNMIYGLTKGQASPTSLKGLVTPVQVNGVDNRPFNPLTAAIAQDASFVSRIFVGDFEQSKEIVKEAIKHKGFSLVDALSPCVTFNKFNTYKWYKENTYYLEDNYKSDNQAMAFMRANEEARYPLGIFYINEQKIPYWKTTAAFKKNSQPLYRRKISRVKLREVINSHRMM